MFIISLLQLIYLIYICFLRPFTEKKCNIIEIINELFFLILFSSLIFLNKESDWINSITSTYIWTIVANTMLVCIIVLASAIIQGVKCIIIRCSKASNSNANRSDVVPKVDSSSGNAIIQRETPSNIDNGDNSESNKSKPQEESKSSVFKSNSEFNSEICIKNEELSHNEINF